jgi:RimJ/RimL family protein N-acetyltransferase
VLGEAILNPSVGVLAGTIGGPHRGRGLAKRAGRLLIDYAHEVLSVPRLLAQMEPDNHAMIAVVESLGFRRTDSEPETWVERGRSITVYTWAHDAE